MALELVTYVDLKKLLSLVDAAITDYPPLDVINATMISAFEEQLGRSLNSEERTENVFIGNSTRSMLKLSAIPITAVSSVTIVQRGESTTFTENTDFEVAEYGLKLWTSLKNSKVTVVYTGGIATVTEEPRLNRAALYQVAFEFQNKVWIAAEQVTAEGGSVQTPTLGLLKETKRMIKRSMHPMHTGKP